MKNTDNHPIGIPHSREIGLFVGHLESDRIKKHFLRLCEESKDLIDWHFLKTTSCTGSVDGHIINEQHLTMPKRSAAMLKNGGYQGGFLDSIIVPSALALNTEFIWIMEYDVDFSGNWHRLFAQFRDSSSDLLTTTLYNKQEDPDWSHWNSARSPENLADHQMFRAFLPIMRVSRRFLIDYAQRVEEIGWAGHYEFTFPTAAALGGFIIEDVGGNGSLCPVHRHGKNYTNTHTHGNLTPGTFVWRPSTEHYFHESPGHFSCADFLYHPVKPGMLDWDAAQTAPVDS